MCLIVTNGFSVTDGIGIRNRASRSGIEMRAGEYKSRIIKYYRRLYKTGAKETGFEFATPCLQNVRLHDTVFRESSKNRDHYGGEL